jgi:broad specificity phosphatase PhoE
LWRKQRDAENFNFETKILEKGESLQDVKNRMIEFFAEIEEK